MKIVKILKNKKRAVTIMLQDGIYRIICSMNNWETISNRGCGKSWKTLKWVESFWNKFLFDN